MRALAKRRPDRRAPCLTRSAAASGRIHATHVGIGRARRPCDWPAARRPRAHRHARQGRHRARAFCARRPPARAQRTSSRRTATPPRPCGRALQRRPWMTRPRGCVRLRSWATAKQWSVCWTAQAQGPQLWPMRATRCRDVCGARRVHALTRPLVRPAAQPLGAGARRHGRQHAGHFCAAAARRRPAALVSGARCTRPFNCFPNQPPTERRLAQSVPSPLEAAAIYRQTAAAELLYQLGARIGTLSEARATTRAQAFCTSTVALMVRCRARARQCCMRSAMDIRRKLSCCTGWARTCSARAKGCVAGAVRDAMVKLDAGGQACDRARGWQGTHDHRFASPQPGH